MQKPGEDRSRVVLAVTAAVIACSTTFVFFRLVSRAGIVKKLLLDDYFILLAWAIAFGLSFAICYATQFGLGRHEQDIELSQRDNLNRLNYVFTVLYNPALMATKTSILVFFLTLSKQRRVFTWTIWVTLFVVNAAGLALLFVNIFQCRPLSATFQQIRSGGYHCTDIVTLYLSSAPVNIITDVVILLLPMPTLKSMHLPRRQKWILYVTFGFGVFIAVVDVVRISYLQDAAVAHATEVIEGQGSRNQRQTEQDSDFTWYAAYSFMWSAIEVNVGIMVASVPALKPLASRFAPQLIRDKVGSKKHDSKTSPAVPDVADDPRQPTAISPPLALHPRDPSNVSYDQDANVDMMDFLTTPDMTEIPAAIERTQTAMTNTSGASRHRTATDFDFVSLTSHKSIVEMSVRESVRPIAETTFLFFLWGFAYGLLNALNGRIQVITRETSTQAIGTHAAYYVGYFVAPLTFGRLILKKSGFRACYIIGLMIYSTGTLIFWPAAVLTSWPAFLVTNFIIGLGLSTLELAANPFIALCGPAKYAEMRLNLSQGIQACGTVFANVLSKKALFNNVLDAPSLIDVQWTYLAISLFTFVLAFVYYIIRVPEVTDNELEDAAEQTNPENLQTLRKTRTIWTTLGLAVFAQFCYVGAQESLATSLDSYVTALQKGADPVNYEAIGQTLFAASRFLSAFLGYFIAPRIQLAFWFLASLVFSALSMNFSGLTAGALVLTVLFCEGPLFALIFAMPLRGLGRHTKDSSALITAAISGGAFFPAIMHVVSTRPQSPHGVQYSYCVPLAAFAFGSVFPLYANIFFRARQQVKRQDTGLPPSSCSSQNARASATPNSDRSRSGSTAPRINGDSLEYEKPSRPLRISLEHELKVPPVIRDFGNSSGSR